MNTNNDSMKDGLFPMRVVTRMTGLSADTIRVWERRYGAVRPERTESNRRRYSAEQVQRLSLLRRASERGHSIGTIANLPAEELSRLAEAETSLAAGGDHYSELVDAYFRAIRNFDMAESDLILTRTAAIVPSVELAFDFVVPLMRRVGELWESGEFEVAHEHVVSGQLRSLLGTLLRQISAPRGSRRILIGTPASHLHEFGALIGAFLAAARGLQPVYLGPNLPFDQIRLAAERSSSEIILLSIARDCTPPEQAQLTAEIRRLAADFSVWLGIPENHDLVTSDCHARLFHGYSELDAAIVHVAGGAV